MARIAEGWRLKWKPSAGGDIAHVRFTHKKRRYEISTGSRDPREATQIAARIYADVIQGRLKRIASGALVHPATPLDGLCADWLDAIANELGEGTGGTYEVYVRHWCKAMKTLGDVTSASIGDYQRSRLGKVTRSSVTKERGALLRCLTWFVERHILAEVPAFPDLPKKSKGKPHPQGRRKPTTVLSAAEVYEVLSECPDTSRDFFVALYETGLRPKSTLERLARADLSPFGLHIRPECDKNGWERTVPLSDRARRALERGLPFGSADRRTGFRAAVVRALGVSRKVTPYDLKHARVSHWVDEGKSIKGIEFLTGTRHALDQYAHPTRGAAESVLWGNSGARPIGDECEGRDLNPHGSYPANTSSLNEPEKRAGSRKRRAGKPPRIAEARSGSGAGPHYSDTTLPAGLRLVLLRRAGVA
jgi:integrase